MRGAEREYFSHDHGWYLPPPGPHWTVESLRAVGTGPCQLNVPGAGLDPAELRRLAEPLEALSVEELNAALSNIPTEWPVTDEDLAGVVEFAYARRTGVAARLRALAETV
jgi:hypothetical protein